MRQLIPLDGEWNFRAIRGTGGPAEARSPHPARVPGTVHTDLLANGLIPDPFFRDAETEVQWIENLDWEYQRTFDRPDFGPVPATVLLVFEGVDTVGEVFLNGRRVGHVENMFIRHSFDVRKALGPGRNILRVVLRSPKRFAMEEERKHGRMFAELDSYRVHIRKAQYSFGWDWGPRLATSGIWRGVHLLVSNAPFIENAQLLTKRVAGERTSLRFILDLHRTGRSKPEGLTVRLSMNDGVSEIERRFPCDRRVDESFTLRGVHPWWPHDLGEPKLHTVTTALLGEGDELVDLRTWRTGFRSVKLDQTPDRFGRRFCLNVNGTRVFARGADWIPADSFLPRVTAEKYHELVHAAKEAGMNMLRVWGGGVYEDESFYTACDEEGILVWQDFMFACASYPHHRAMAKSVEKEAVQNVQRLSNHPSVALFCGNNESEWIWRMKTGRPVDEMPGTPLFKRILPHVVRTHAPGVPYWRSSPFGGDDPNSGREGNHHEWNVWSNFRSFREYETVEARFVTEFGFQAPPAIHTVREFTSPEDRDLQSRIMRHHNKQIEGTERLFRFLAGEVRLAHRVEDVILQMQLVQAEAIRTGVLHWRSAKWRTAGTLYWQLNDCCPVTSWSAIDFSGRPKALYYYSRRFYRPVKVVIRRIRGGVGLVSINDTREDIPVALRVVKQTLAGRVIEEGREAFILKGGGLRRSAGIPVTDEEAHDVFFRATLTRQDSGELLDDDDRILVPWLDLGMGGPQVSGSAANDEDGATITLRSHGYTPGVCLEAEERLGELTDNFFTLYPGEERVVHFARRLSSDGIVVRFPLFAGHMDDGLEQSLGLMMSIPLMR
ncbi:MAG: hypothetical protein COS95_02835 [Ignavibacteriales bacterium CG07_land_8_20_14_0_80_59_12]|nr:MAG: hypothetical protein COS95_02835 [Ignavibacteriales bacterium CG07_land_8_20_14_0_80_59_12]